MKSKSSIPRSHNVYFEKTELLTGIKKRAFRSAGAVVFSQISLYFINMFSVIVLARLVTPNDFGLVAMVTAPFGIILDIGNFGLGEAVVQSEKINHRQVSTLFWINVTICLALAGLLILLAPIISIFYNEGRLRSICMTIALVYILSSLSTQHLALLKRNMQYYSVTAIDMVSALMSVVIAITMAWHGWGYWAIVSRYLFSSVFTTAGAWLATRWCPGLPSLKTGIGPLLKFGANLLGSNIIFYFTKQTDKVLLGWRCGSQSLGHYDRAYHLFSMPINILVSSLGNVAFSALSRVRHDHELFIRYYLRSVSLLGFVGMPLSVVFALTGRDLILLLLGPQWNVAGQMFSVLSLSIGISLIYMTYGWINLSMGRADRQIRWNLLAFLCTLLFVAIGLMYGAFGVVLAFTITPCVLILPGLSYAGKIISLRVSSIVSELWKFFVAAFISGGLSWLALYRIEPISKIFASFHVVPRLMISSALCTVMYLIFVAILYKSVKPIMQFLKAVYEMIPRNNKTDISKDHASSDL